MKIYNIEDVIFYLVNPNEKKYIGFDINDESIFIMEKVNYENSELTTKIPDSLRDQIFWTLFAAYGDARYHNEHNDEVFDVLIRVLS